jgi:hypothetical protein
MHPNERPPTIRALREMLFGSAPIPHQTAFSTGLTRFQGSDQSWNEVFYANRYLIASAAGLLLLALILSL